MSIGTSDAEFARQLETELSQATQLIARSAEQMKDRETADRLIDAYIQHNKTLETELAAMTKERDRLRDVKWEGIAKLESELKAEPREGREAAHRAMVCKATHSV